MGDYGLPKGIARWRGSTDEAHVLWINVGKALKKSLLMGFPCI